MPYREGGGGGPVVGTSLIENAGQVVDHRLFAEDQRFGNLAITFARRDQAQDFNFPRAQTCRKRLPGRGSSWQALQLLTHGVLFSMQSPFFEQCVCLLKQEACASHAAPSTLSEFKVSSCHQCVPQ